MLNGKVVLVTGGTGSFGHKFVELTLKKYPDIKKLIIFSRDEMKQFHMAQLYPESQYPQLRYFIGDVRDYDRLEMACENVDVIIHAAALKHVPIAEYNPMECIKTNILGAENVIQAARAMGVKRVVALSTDKAAAPINLYGATKLCSDKLFVAGNNIKGSRDLRMCVVRYGNVMGSRGSVIPFFLEKRDKGPIPVTDERMTRFNITLEQGVELVYFAIENCWGGEIFIPKIPSYKILDIVKAVAPNREVRFIGIRPGEKIHEEMITTTDSLRTVDCGSYYVILPNMAFWSEKDFIEKWKAKAVPENFCYNSGANTDWLSVDELRTLIRQNVDPNFNVSEI